MSLATEMHRQVEHARKEARIASMERVTQLEDEVRRLVCRNIELERKLRSHLEGASVEIARLEGEIRVRAAAIRRLSRKTYDLEQELIQLKSVEVNPRLGMMIAEDLRRSRSC